MAWERVTIKVGEEETDGFFRAGPPLEVTIPWIVGVSVGAAVELRGKSYRIVSVRDPGNRHEILELGLDPPPREPLPRPTNKRDRLVAITAEIASLDRPAHFTDGGKPDANVLSDRLGWRVTARERDEAWEAGSDYG